MSWPTRCCDRISDFGHTMYFSLLGFGRVFVLAAWRDERKPNFRVLALVPAWRVKTRLVSTQGTIWRSTLATIPGGHSDGHPCPPPTSG